MMFFDKIMIELYERLGLHPGIDAVLFLLRARIRVRDWVVYSENGIDDS